MRVRSQCMRRPPGEFGQRLSLVAELDLLRNDIDDDVYPQAFDVAVLEFAAYSIRASDEEWRSCGRTCLTLSARLCISGVVIPRVAAYDVA